MFHEQQRRDRGAFIAIATASIKLERTFDFAMVSADEGMPVGAYDINSIMHYGDSKNASIDGKTSIITRANGTPLPPRSNNLTPGDIASAAELNRGNAHIYQLSNNGQLERTIQQSAFSDGWTSVSPYTLDVRQFLLLLKRGGGAGSLRAFNMKLDGTIGDPVYNLTVTAGWTSVVTYGVLGSTYAFMYRSASGLVRVRPIRLDGALAPVSDSVKFNLEADYTSISHYAVGLNNFLLLVNANSGEFRVRRVDANGLPGEVVQTATVDHGVDYRQAIQHGRRQLPVQIEGWQWTGARGAYHGRRLDWSQDR